MAGMLAEGKTPDILFWVGCAGSFDDRAKKITKAIAKILEHCKVSYAVLGTEESCTGDPAKRAGNEFTFQMQAMMNIQVLNGYDVKRIVTGCPHCFNTLKNEYPELGGEYEVIHHTQLIQDLINTGKLALKGGETYKGKKITFHDPCYLGRHNAVYDDPRDALTAIPGLTLVEMEKNRDRSLCCSGGGLMLFYEPHEDERMAVIRVNMAVEAGANVIVCACPFCLVNMEDAIKVANLDDKLVAIELTELIAAHIE